MKTELEQKISAYFSPTHIELVDESHLHAGHAGVREKGGSHFNLLLVSDMFNGKNKVARQRMVYALLENEMQNQNRAGIHALSMKLYTPAEFDEV